MFNTKPICPLVVDLPADLFIILSTNHIFFFYNAQISERRLLMIMALSINSICSRQSKTHLNILLLPGCSFKI